MAEGIVGKIIVEATFTSEFEVARRSVHGLDSVKEHVSSWTLPTSQHGVRCAFEVHPDKKQSFVESLKRLPSVKSIDHVYITKKEGP